MNTNKLNKWIVTTIILLAVNSNGFCQKNEAKIKVSNFTVNVVGKHILIDWATESGFQANYFEIQRSLDGVNFKTIELVLGPDPQKPEGNSYEGFDKSSTNNKYYYRLKHVSLDGSEALSETKMLAINN